jgi:hypothetical protein
MFITIRASVLVSLNNGVVGGINIVLLVLFLGMARFPRRLFLFG